MVRYNTLWVPYNIIYATIIYGSLKYSYMPSNKGCVAIYDRFGSQNRRANFPSTSFFPKMTLNNFVFYVIRMVDV